MINDSKNGKLRFSFVVPRRRHSPRVVLAFLACLLHNPLPEMGCGSSRDDSGWGEDTGSAGVTVNGKKVESSATVTITRGGGGGGDQGGHVCKCGYNPPANLPKWRCASCGGTNPNCPPGGGGQAATPAPTAPDPVRSGPLVPGALTMESAKVGMAVKITTDRNAMAVALKQIGNGFETPFQLKNRCDLLGKKGMIRKVVHEHTQNQMALCDVEPSFQLMMPKVVLIPIDASALPPLPDGWLDVGNGQFKNKHTGKLTSERPMHRAYNPAEEARKEAAASGGGGDDDDDSDSDDSDDESVARLCRDCAFGFKKEECVVCAKRANRFVTGHLCRNCGFGHSSKKCARKGCNNWAKDDTKAVVCHNCAFGNKAKLCCVCRKRDY